MLRAPCRTPGAAARDRGAVAPVEALAGRLDADQCTLVVVEAAEEPDRVRTAAHAGDDLVREAPVASSICARASSPITDWSAATISGYGCGPTTEPIT